MGSKHDINQLKWGAVLSYGQMALSILIGVIYTPVMIRLLGKSEYGLYNTVASTISMFGILSLGFNSGYIRYYSRYRKNDELKIDSLNGLFLIIFLVIGAVALVCGLFLTEHLELVFKDGLTAGEYQIAKTLMLLMTISLSLSFPFSVFGTIISAHERFVFAKLVGIISSVISPLISLPLLLLGYRSIALVSVLMVLSILAGVIQVYYVLIQLGQKFVFHNFEKGLFVSLFSYTGFIALNMIVDQVNKNVDNLILARFQGTAMVSVYAVGASLYSYYERFSTSISGVFTPRIHRIVNTNRDDVQALRTALTELFIRVGRIQFLLLGLICSGFIFFGRQFILLYWAGSGYEDSYYVVLLLMIPSTVPLIQNLGIEIQRAQNLHKFRAVFYTAMAVCNLLLSIYLCQRYGAIGSAIGTAIAVVLANGIGMNVFYHKRCNIDVLKFWKSILMMSTGLIIPIISAVMAVRLIQFNSLIKMLVGMAVYTIVYCASMWLISMNKYEKQLILAPIKRFQN